MFTQKSSYVADYYSKEKDQFQENYHPHLLLKMYN